MAALSLGFNAASKSINPLAKKKPVALLIQLHTDRSAHFPLTFITETVWPSHLSPSMKESILPFSFISCSILLLMNVCKTRILNGIITHHPTETKSIEIVIYKVTDVMLQSVSNKLNVESMKF